MTVWGPASDPIFSAQWVFVFPAVGGTGVLGLRPGKDTWQWTCHFVECGPCTFLKITWTLVMPDNLKIKSCDILIWSQRFNQGCITFLYLVHSFSHRRHTQAVVKQNCTWELDTRYKWLYCYHMTMCTCVSLSTTHWQSVTISLWHLRRQAPMAWGHWLCEVSSMCNFHYFENLPPDIPEKNMDLAFTGFQFIWYGSFLQWTFWKRWRV